MVDGHSAIRGFPRDFHLEKASGGEQFLLVDGGFIGERVVKVLNDFGEEHPKGRNLWRWWFAIKEKTIEA